MRVKITKIDVTDLQFDRQSDRHRGHVSLHMRAAESEYPVLMHFLCSAAGQAEDRPREAVERLIEDALRQARRMPGFRRGERWIERGAQPANISAA